MSGLGRPILYDCDILVTVHLLTAHAGVDAAEQGQRGPPLCEVRGFSHLPALAGWVHYCPRRRRLTFRHSQFIIHNHNCSCP